MTKKISIIILCVLFIALIILANTFINKYTNDEYQGDIDIKNGNTDLIKTESGDNKEEGEEVMEILELTSENFETEVLKSEKTVLVDFYADWCGPCKMMAPVIEKIASENQDIKVCKVNVDNEQSLAMQYRVMSIPTFLIIKNGDVADRIVGAVSKSELEAIINK